MKIIVLLFLSCAGLALTMADVRGNTFVQFDYNVPSASHLRTSVFVELYDDRPATTANFLQYVNGGFFNNSLMHRLAITSGVPFVLQGGGYYPQYFNEPATPLQRSLNPAFKVDLDNTYATPNPTVIDEFNKPEPHPNVKGTIAMALSSSNGINSIPNSGSNQYFFNLNDNHASLDGAFTVFAKVAGDGMSLIDVYANQLLDGPAIYHNLNPDTNDDGTPEDGPFGTVPIYFGSTSFVPLIVNRARVVDYLGSGLATDVPANGLTFANKDVFIDTGASFTGTGRLIVGAGRSLGVREHYVIDRPVENHGTLAPGLSLGVIGIESNYYQFFDGALSLQLAGTTVDAQYDKLIVGGTAFLAGKLQLSLTSFTPVRDDSFTVLTAASIVGSFSSYDLPQLASGQAWRIDQSATSITLKVVQGDYNRNGVVDAGDYVVWRKTRNKGVTAWSGADGNGDSVINDSDLAIWRTNLGAIGGGVHGAGASNLAISSVPEPAGGLLVLSAVLLFSALPRRREATRQHRMA